MSPDTELEKSVLAALSWEPSVMAHGIGVVAKNGTVTLTGHVATYLERCVATATVLRVKGVKAIADEIDVRLPHHFKRRDADIAAAALSRLAWDAAIPIGAVQVTVENGIVTLSGVLDWQYQREAAEQDVRSLIGVSAISNQTSIKQNLSASNISDDIMLALDRSWFYEPRTIQVSVAGGTVRLSGSVRTPDEKDVAAAAAWAAPGATAVQNDIAII